MFENLDWNSTPTSSSYGGVKVGKVEITSGVTFSIDRHMKDHWENGRYVADGFYFTVGIEAYGCSICKNFVSPEDVIDYIKDQMTKVPQYEAIKARRDAISKRIIPLNKKWDATGTEIFNLLKS